MFVSVFVFILSPEVELVPRSLQDTKAKTPFQNKNYLAFSAFSAFK
jgi:hypothetical protein